MKLGMGASRLTGGQTPPELAGGGACRYALEAALGEHEDWAQILA
jgi:hypothetical protein